MKRLLLLGLLIVAFVLAPFGRVEAAPADLPDQINYQGTLVNGDTKINQSVSMTFELFESETGGTAVWQENQNVDVTEGYFNVNLGRSKPLNVVEFDKQLFLQVTVGGGQPYARTPLTLVPYAGMAKAAVNADTATVALAIVDKGVTQDMLADGVMAIPMGDAGGDLEGQYPNPTIKPEAVLNNIPDGGITQNMLAPNVSTTPSGPASGDLTGTYPDPIIAPRAITAEKIGLGVVKPEHLDTDGAMEDYVLYMNEMGEVQWGPVPSPLNKLGHGQAQGQMVWWDNNVQEWAYSHNVVPTGGQMMTWNEEFGIPQWKDANFTLPITHNGPTEGQTAIDITKTDVNGGGVYISVPQTETNGQALKVMGGGDNVATAHIDRTTDGESSEGALLVTTNLTTLEGTSYGAKFMTNTNADNGYMTSGVKVENNVVGATANMVHKGIEVTSSSDNGLAVAGHFVANNDNVDGWVSAGNPNPTGAVVIENTSGVAGKIALVTKGDIYWNSTAHGHNLEILNGIVVGEGADAITIAAPAAGDNLTFNKDVDFDANVNVAGQITTGSFSITNDITVGGNANITGGVTAATFSGNGAAITDINADNITTGTLADARLTANVALYDAPAPTFVNDVTAPTFIGNLTGDVTGNVTGNVSGTAANITGDLDVDQLVGDVNDDDIIDRAIVDAMTVYTDVAPTFTVDVTAPNFVGNLNGNATSATTLSGDLDVDQLMGDVVDDDIIDRAIVDAMTVYTDVAPTFTVDVTAPNFIGNLTGNATTATSATNLTGDLDVDQLMGDVVDNDIIDRAIVDAMTVYTDVAPTFTVDVTAPNFVGNVNGTATLTALTVNGNSLFNGMITAQNGQISQDFTVGADLTVDGNTNLSTGNLQFNSTTNPNAQIILNGANAQINMNGANAQINMPNGNLVVDDIQANTGTITTLNSTTGNVTTLNSTTGNITTVNATDVNSTNATLTGVLQALTANITGILDGNADLTVNDATIGALTITNDLNIGGNLGVTGTGTFGGDVTAPNFNGNLVGGTVSGTTGTFTGLVTAQGGLNVTGNITATGDVTALNFNGNLVGGTVSGTTGTFTGDLAAANGTFTGNVGAVDGNFTGNVGAVNGTFTGNVGAVDGTFTGNGSFGGTLGVTGATTLSDALTVAGATQINNTFATTGNTTLGDAPTDVITLNGTTTSNGDLILSGAGSDLTVDGHAEFNTTANIDGTLNVGGHTTLNTFGSSGNGSVGGTFAVTGATTLNNTTINGPFTANGIVQIADVDAGAGIDLDVNGDADFAKTVTINGVTTLTSNLNANGAVTIADNAVSPIDLQVNGVSAFAAAVTMGSTLGVTGTSTLADVNAANVDVTTLDATGNATVGGTLNVTGATTMSTANITTANVTTENVTTSNVTTLNTNGVVTIAETINPFELVVNGQSDFNSTANFDGAVTMGSTLAVTGATTLTGDLNANGAINAGGILTVAQTAAPAELIVNGEADFNVAANFDGAVTMTSTLGVTGASTFGANMTMTAGQFSAQNINSNAALFFVENEGTGHGIYSEKNTANGSAFAGMANNVAGTATVYTADVQNGNTGIQVSASETSIGQTIQSENGNALQLIATGTGNAAFVAPGGGHVVLSYGTAATPAAVKSANASVVNYTGLADINDAALHMPTGENGKVMYIFTTNAINIFGTGVLANTLSTVIYVNGTWRVLN